jgi:hypothetical protein
MSLLTIIVILVVVGLILYLINRLLPIDGNIKTIINVVVILIVIIWLLRIFLPAADIRI